MGVARIRQHMGEERSRGKERGTGYCIRSGTKKPLRLHYLVYLLHDREKARRGGERLDDASGRWRWADDDEKGGDLPRECQENR